MEWLIVPFIVAIAGWWSYVIHRRKKREASELDRRLKAAADTKWMNHIRDMEKLKANQARERVLFDTKQLSKSQVKRIYSQTPVGHQVLPGYDWQPVQDDSPRFTGGGGESAGASSSWDSGSSSSNSSNGGSDGNS